MEIKYVVISIKIMNNLIKSNKINLLFKIKYTKKNIIYNTREIYLKRKLNI